MMPAVRFRFALGSPLDFDFRFRSVAPGFALFFALHWGFVLSQSANPADPVAESRTKDESRSDARPGETTPSLSIFDVFTTGAVASSAPISEIHGGEPPLSAVGAGILLEDAREFFREHRIEQGRALLFTVLARRPADDPAALEALLWLAHTDEIPEDARSRLRAILDSGAKTIPSASSTVALSWARAFESSDASQGRGLSSGTTSNEASLLLWIELAERLALRSGVPGRIEEAVLARARHHLHSRQPQAAWHTMAAAEESGLVGKPTAAWLDLCAEAAMAMRRWDDAILSLSRLVALHPEAPEATRQRPRYGLLLEMADRPEDARRHYDTILQDFHGKANERWLDTRLRALANPYFVRRAAPRKEIAPPRREVE